MDNNKPQKIEALGFLISEEKLSRLPKGKTIAKANDIHTAVRFATKIQNLPIEDVTMLVSYVMLLVGLPERSLPANEENAYTLLNMLHEELAPYSIEEVKVAFKMASKKKIEAEINLFDRTLNPEYFHNVVNAYREYCGKHNLVKPLIDVKTEEEIMEEQNRRAEYYNIKKKRILQLFNDSNILGINQFEELSRDEASLLFDCYEQICWLDETGRNLWRICDIDLETIEDTEMWKEAVETVRKESLANGDKLKDLIKGLIQGQDRTNVMKVIKHNALINLMFEKMV